MRILLSLIFLFLISIPHYALAAPLTASVSGTEITVNYDEPSLNSNTPPTALTDLSHTTIFIQPVVGAGFTTVVPATSPTGGGAISQQIIVPVAENAETDVDIWATATDLTGNMSVDSPSTSVRIDRLAPAGIE